MAEAADEHRDELPDDLDVTQYVGMYTFPDIRRRRWPAFAYLLLAAAWPLAVRDTDALLAAAGDVGFPVGHASAQLGWRGLRSRPTWRILLYSGEDPPARRGLVLVDAVDGRVLDHFVEDNPEDWS